MGHARAIINIESVEIQLNILEKIIANNLTVREVERMVKEVNGQKKSIEKRIVKPLPEKHEIYKENLSINLDTTVDVRRNTKGKGSIVISFNSDEEFDRIISILKK